MKLPEFIDPDKVTKEDAIAMQKAFYNTFPNMKKIWDKAYKKLGKIKYKRFTK